MASIRAITAPQSLHISPPVPLISSLATDRIPLESNM
jgi:hypothetical protein